MPSVAWPLPIYRYILIIYVQGIFYSPLGVFLVFCRCIYVCIYIYIYIFFWGVEVGVFIVTQRASHPLINEWGLCVNCVIAFNIKVVAQFLPFVTLCFAWLDAFEGDISRTQRYAKFLKNQAVKSLVTLTFYLFFNSIVKVGVGLVIWWGKVQGNFTGTDKGLVETFVYCQITDHFFGLLCSWFVSIRYMIVNHQYAMWQFIFESKAANFSIKKKKKNFLGQFFCVKKRS